MAVKWLSMNAVQTYFNNLLNKKSIKKKDLFMFWIVTWLQNSWGITVKLMHLSPLLNQHFFWCPIRSGLDRMLVINEINCLPVLFINVKIINLPHLDLTQSVAERVVIDSVRFTGGGSAPDSSRALHFWCRRQQIWKRQQIWTLSQLIGNRLHVSATLMLTCKLIAGWLRLIAICPCFKAVWRWQLDCEWSQTCFLSLKT